MRMANSDAGLAAMAGEARGGMKQRTIGNGLGMLTRISQAHEQDPPIVDQRRDARHEAAALGILGGETTKTTIVFHLIEGIFRVGAVTIKLRDGEDFVGQ